MHTTSEIRFCHVIVRSTFLTMCNVYLAPILKMHLCLVFPVYSSVISIHYSSKPPLLAKQVYHILFIVSSGFSLFFFFQLNISSTYQFFCLLLTRLRLKNDKKYPCNFLSAFFDLSGSALLKAKNAAISYFYIYQKSYNHCLTESRSIHHACEITNSD